MRCSLGAFLGCMTIRFLCCDRRRRPWSIHASQVDTFLVSEPALSRTLLARSQALTHNSFAVKRRKTVRIPVQLHLAPVSHTACVTIKLNNTCFKRVSRSIAQHLGSQAQPCTQGTGEEIMEAKSFPVRDHPPPFVPFAPFPPQLSAPPRMSGKLANKSCSMESLWRAISFVQESFQCSYKSQAGICITKRGCRKTLTAGP